MAYETQLARTEIAYGNDNPTLSFNPANPFDYNPGLQFIDLMKMMRPWIGHKPGEWGGMSIEELQSGGYLDENGWLKEIPENVSRVGTVWAWNSFPDFAVQNSGIYILQYEGEGSINIGGEARVISSEPGRIVIENPEHGQFMLDIRETDPQGTGDYIRNITLVAEEHLALYEAGAIYNPQWLDLVADSRDFRFMGWMKTNSSDIKTWDNRPTPDQPHLGNGVSVEDMVRLANETGTDPWFTISHLADEEYIRKFAEYVRDNLDPSLTVRVEYSNEVWNWAFDQTHWMLKQSQSEWGVNAHHDFHAKKAVETALIWEEVFGVEAGNRLINVLGTHTANPWTAGRLLNPTVWKENEPDRYVEPSTVFEELAVTTYFGTETVSSEELRDELIAAINDPNIDAIEFLAGKLLDPDYPSSIPDVANWLAGNAAVADRYGLNLVAYEGGQHVHHSFAVSGLTEADLAAINDFMIEFVRSPEMGELYRELWDVWVQYGDGAAMQLGDVQAPNKWGSWGLYSSLYDSTPRSDLLEDLNATTDPWWDGAVGGEFRQQGLTLTGTVDGDMMIGTSQEDYLLGMAGNDVLVGGKGNDGYNGGDGVDRMVLNGTIDDYVIRAEGDGYRIRGLDGSDFAIHVEEMAFSGDQIVKFSQLVEDSAGRLVLIGTPTEIDGPGKGKGIAGNGKVTNGNKYDKVKVVDANGGKKGVKITAIDDGSRLDNVLATGEEDVSYLSYSVGTNDPTISFVRKLDGSGKTAGVSIKNGAIVKDAPEILATGKQDIFLGKSGNDAVQGMGGNDRMLGGGGRDKLLGNDGQDTISGGHGNDSLNGGAHKDRIEGGKGHDVVKGGGGNDRMAGNEGMDRMLGGGGNDIMRGGADNDTIDGGKGRDMLLGGMGQDKLIGGSMRDVLKGDGGRDKLIGGGGDDVLRGGAGQDVLVGGKGNDILSGGAGADTFVFGKGSGRDVITNFTAEDTLILNDFLREGRSVEDAARMVKGDLVISNGTDKIIIEDFRIGTIDWNDLDAA